MAQLKQIFGVTLLCNVLAQVQAWTTHCGFRECHGFVTCCAYDRFQCCYASVWGMWWFWLVWGTILLVCLSCGCWCRQRRRRQREVNYRIIDGQAPHYGGTTVAPVSPYVVAPVAPYNYASPQGAQAGAAGYPPPYNPTQYPPQQTQKSPPPPAYKQ